MNGNIELGDFTEIARKQIHIVKKSLNKTSRLMFDLTPQENSRIITAFATGLLARSIISVSENLTEDRHRKPIQSAQLSTYRNLLIEKALHLAVIAKNHMLTVNIELYREEDMSLNDLQRQCSNAEETVSQVAQGLIANSKIHVAQQLIHIWQDGITGILEASKNLEKPSSSSQDNTVGVTGTHNDQFRGGAMSISNRRVVAIVTTILIVVPLVLFAINTLNNSKMSDKDIQDLRGAAKITCEASVRNSINGIYGKDMEKEGVNYENADENTKTKLNELTWSGITLDPDSASVSPCTSASDKNGDPVVIGDFLKYAVERRVSASHLLSPDRSHLSDYGKELFIESLGITFKDAIEESR